MARYHKNMLTRSRSQQDDNDGKTDRGNMLEAFDELKIDLALQGHDHIYEVMCPVKNISKSLIASGIEQMNIVSDGNERENMTGKQGGVFNVYEGTLYFLNNSAGKKKYEPRDEDQMIASYDKHEVENYWGLFSGKFGQTGEATFSKVNITSDEIEITTYTVNADGKANEFDSLKVIKEERKAANADET